MDKIALSNLEKKWVRRVRDRCLHLLEKNLLENNLNIKIAVEKLHYGTYNKYTKAEVLVITEILSWFNAELIIVSRIHDDHIVSEIRWN